jgi:hypothetical protein
VKTTQRAQAEAQSFPTHPQGEKAMTRILEIAPGYAEAQMITQVRIDWHGTRLFYFVPTSGDVVCLDLHPHRSIQVERYNTLHEAIKGMFAHPDDDVERTVKEVLALANPPREIALLLARLDFEKDAEVRVWQPDIASFATEQPAE